MRLFKLLKGDIRFQLKYGFYLIYAIFTILYSAILLSLPENLKEKAAILLIFTDPAAMGLFFMGAIVLLEKSEKVLSALAVSPVKPLEYVLSKLLSLALISLLIGLILGIFGGVSNLFALALGLIFSSALCTAFGLILACKVKTLNGFIILTLPIELFLMLPSLAYLFGFIKSPFFLLHPGISAIELLSGGSYSLLSFFILLLWTAALCFLSLKSVQKTFLGLGGGKS